ncbi:reverse transcriptase domain-containing protein [Tanacetum coccineum]
MYIDGGSSTEILYEHCFKQTTPPEIKSRCPPRSRYTVLVEKLYGPGTIRLLVTIGDADHCTKVWMDFMIVRSISPYNGIIGRSGIREIKAVPSTVHGMLKFPADGGIVNICSIILIPAECATMAESDEEKMAFHTSQGVYCYTKMPFGLKNAGATYERLVNKDFDSQVGRNMEVYVNDLVIKSHTEAEMLRDIGKTFRTSASKKRLPLDIRSGTSLQVTKTSFVRATPAGSTQTEGRIDCILVRLLWSWPRPKLYSNGKASSVTSFCRQEAVEIQADFLVEKPDENPSETSAVETLPEPWTLFTDGSSCVDGSGAEYEALIAGLRIAAQMGVRNIQVSVDSKLVANQVLGTYVVKEENMIKYLEKVKNLVSGFANFSISQVPRNKNKKVESLSKIASTSFAHLSKQVLVEVIKEKSIQEKEVTTVVEEDGPTWMTPIIEYLKDGTLPSDRKEASKLRIKARQYELLEGILYKRSFLKPWLRYVGPLQANYVIYEIHEGSCSMHAEQRDNLFKDWCDKLNITQQFASVKHPQSNGLVERANQSLGKGIKAHMGEGNKNWIEELPHVLWAHRTMIKSSHGDTPFPLTYGMEAVIPTEIGMPTYSTAAVDTVHNDDELRLNLDLLEEKRERAAIREAKAKMKMTKYYNAKVRGVAFRHGDFVSRSNNASHAVPGENLGPKWEGPYKVTEALGDGAYKLRTMEGTDLPWTWNIANLKKCYLYAAVHAWMNSRSR